MNIENLQILTGTPDKVEKKAEAYFAKHTNARILGTALSVHRAPKAVKEEKDAKPAKPAAKKAAKNAANSPKEDDKAAEAEAPAAVLVEVEMEDVTTVSITIARVWD
jgi:hypothetical protein